MRADRIAPATWLLATVAAWAVVAAALAWAGMGGRIRAEAGATAAAQPLPQPAAEAAEVVPAAYDAFAARPPFAQDRQPHPFSLPGGEGEGARGDAAGFDYALTSVLITPRLRLAIVEPAAGGESVRVREGESAEGLGGWRLVELRPRAAVFEGPGGRRELPLRVWAGGGDGAAPAAMPLQQAAQAPMPPPASAPVPDMSADPAPAAAPAPTQVQQQMDAIRRRIEARRAQLRREAQQDTPQARPARNP